jgi:hypothetical protein
MAPYTTGAIFFLYRVNGRLLKRAKTKEPPYGTGRLFQISFGLENLAQ